MHRRDRARLPDAALTVPGRSQRPEPAPGSTEARSTRRTRRDEVGTSVIGTTFGFVVFLGFLLFAVNVAVGLYARSTATAIGFDQARLLAEQGPGCAGEASATQSSVVARLDGWWRRVDVDASCDGEAATVRVDATSSRSLLPSALLRPTRLAELHRTFTVRIEVPR